MVRRGTLSLARERLLVVRPRGGARLALFPAQVGVLAVQPLVHQRVAGHVGQLADLIRQPYAQSGSRWRRHSTRPGSRAATACDKALSWTLLPALRIG